MNDAIGEIKSLEAAIELLGPASVHAKLRWVPFKSAWIHAGSSSKRQDLECARLEFLGCRVKPQWAVRRRPSGGEEGGKNVEHSQKYHTTTTQNRGTQPNARPHLTKHGPNTKTQILAKCGLAKCGQKH